MSDPQPKRPRPRAFRLDGEQIVPPRPAAAPGTEEARKPFAEVIEPQADVFSSDFAAFNIDADEHAVEEAQAEGVLKRMVLSWGGLFVSSLLGLISLAAGLWATQLVEDLIARSYFFGGIALLCALALLVAATALAFREFRAIARQNHIARLHIAFAEAHAKNEIAPARARVEELCRLYEDRPALARTRATTLEYAKGIMDGRDLVDLAERSLVAPLDEDARREIAAAAKRVSVVTTVSPRALLDVLFVAGQAIVLTRRIAEIYGGRPGLLGFFKLARSVVAHLAITGSLAVGDSILQQIVGHGIAARLSARLGEGVLNGLLTARVGLSAMAVCRPMPFNAEKQPGVTEVAPFLFGDKTKS